MTGSRNRATLLILIILGLIFLSLYYSGSGTGAISYVQKTVSNTVAPLHRLSDKLISPIGRGWNYVVSFSGMRQENDDLRVENDDLKKELGELVSARSENERLKKLVGLKEGTGFETVPARVIGRSSSSWQAILIIDKGSKDGLEKNMPAIVNEGVVGKVLKVGSSTAEVLLLTDEESGIGVEVERTGQLGIAEGRTGGGLRLKYVPKESDIVVGDILKTSGIGLVYPRHLFVGEVLEVDEDQYSMEKKVKVKPGVNFKKLEELLVVTKPIEKDLPGGGRQ